MRRHEGKVALCAGSATGMGAETALRLGGAPLGREVEEFFWSFGVPTGSAHVCRLIQAAVRGGVKKA